MYVCNLMGLVNKFMSMLFTYYVITAYDFSLSINCRYTKMLKKNLKSTNKVQIFSRKMYFTVQKLRNNKNHKIRIIYIYISEK